MSDWPGSNDYTIAVQSPRLCFRDADLSGGTVECNTLTGMPKVWTGNFAQVYEIRTASARWAVKCFTRSSAEIRTRYAAVAKALAKARLPHFVDFTFVDDEMLVNGRRYPIVKMQWADGQSLDAFVHANLYNPKVLFRTANALLRIVKDLERRRLVHGDLQHGNIIVTPSAIKLIDYDGMFVAALARLGASETGLPGYQHPRRTPAHYGIGLDRFSLLVICTGLCALAADPSLWDEFNTGENFLFRSADFKDPTASPLIARLAAIRDPRLRAFLDALTAACARDPLSVPFPKRPIDAGAAPAHSACWIPKPESGQHAAATGQTDRPQVGRSFWSRRRLRAAASIGGVLAFLTLTARFAGPVGPIVGFVAAIGLTLGEFVRYRRLPSLRRQRELRVEVRRHQRRVLDEMKNAAAAEAQVASVDQEQGQVESIELKRLQEAHVDALLATVHIFRLMEIDGIGPYVVSTLRDAGVRNALELKRRGMAAPALDAKWSVPVARKLAEWERQAAVGAPQALPVPAANRVARRFRERRQALQSEADMINRRVADLTSDLTRARLALGEVIVPTFWQFLWSRF